MSGIDSEYEAFCADWAGVPTATRHAFARWWHAAFRPALVEPWFPPFAVAASMPDASLRSIRLIGKRGLRAIRARASREAAAP